MSAQEFVKRLSESAPSREELLKSGISSDLSSKIISSYNIPKREEIINISFPIHNDLIDLVENYNASHLEVGIIDFLDIPINYGSFLQFAVIEIDPMVLYLDGTVKVLDSQQLNHVLWDCAVDAEHFLEALTLCSEFFSLRVINEDIYNDDDYALKVAASAAQFAGNEDFAIFYEMMFGV